MKSRELKHTILFAWSKSSDSSNLSRIIYNGVGGKSSVTRDDLSGLYYIFCFRENTTMQNSYIGMNDNLLEVFFISMSEDLLTRL